MTQTVNVPVAVTEHPAHRDDYGRPVRDFYANRPGAGWGMIAVICTLPRTWTEKYPEKRYLVAERRREIPMFTADGKHREPVYFKTLNQARAHVQAMADAPVKGA